MGMHSGDNVPGAMEGPNIRFLGNRIKSIIYVASIASLVSSFLFGTIIQAPISRQDGEEGLLAHLVDSRAKMESVDSYPAQAITCVLDMLREDGYFEGVPDSLSYVAFPDSLGGRNQYGR